MLPCVAGACFARARLIGNRPHHHAGVVLVAGDELANRLGVRGLRGVVDRRLRECRLHDAAEDATAHRQVEADGRRLVDDDDAVTVSEVHHLFGIWIVRGAERVGADVAS